MPESVPWTPLWSYPEEKVSCSEHQFHLPGQTDIKYYVYITTL